MEAEGSSVLLHLHTSVVHFPLSARRCSVTTWLCPESVDMADSTRQREATPLVLPSSEDPAERLEHLPLGNPPFREGKLQELLADHPEVLPVAEIEPAYAPLICLGREISTPSGSLDVLYISPSGYLTLVEAKLWDNPEARREVVGQIVEYAKDFSRWGFDALDDAVRKADGAEKAGILEQVRQRGHDVNSSSFVDTVTQKLTRGEFLLLIVGNGIREDLKSLASYLQGTPNLHFSLRLIELALFRLRSDQNWPIMVQPRVVGRTSEVTRAVVDVQTSDDVDVTVELPEEDEDDTSSRKTLTEAAFFDQLAENTSAQTAEVVSSLIEDITALGPVRKWRSSSVSLRLPDPGDLDRHWTVIVFRKEGTFRLGWLNRISEDGGYDPEIWEKYLKTVIDLTGATRREDDTKPEPIQSLLQNRAEYVEAARRFVDRIHTAVDARDG